MKKIALILAALVAGASLTADEPAAPASNYSITLDFPYASKYVFRGVQYAEGSLQPSIKAVSGSFYAGIWANKPTDSAVDHEIDLYAGYGFKLSDTWSLDLGATYYTYPNSKDTFEGYVGFNGTFGNATVGAYGYYDFTIEVFTVQGSVGYGIPLGASAKLNLSANLGRAIPDAGGDYTYYGFGAQVPFTVSASTTITLGVNYASHDIALLDDSNFWFNAGVTFTF